MDGGMVAIMIAPGCWAFSGARPEAFSGVFIREKRGRGLWDGRSMRNGDNLDSDLLREVQLQLVEPLYDDGIQFIVDLVEFHFNNELTIDLQFDFIGMQVRM